MRDFVDWRTGVFSSARIHGLYAHWVSTTPHKVALEEHDASLSYAQLDRMVDLAVADLTEAGLCPGDRLLIVGENCSALGVLLFAASKLGASAVICNARLSAPEVDNILVHAQPRVAAFTVAASNEAGKHAAGHSTVEAPWSKGAVMLAQFQGDRGDSSSSMFAEQNVAVILYTSGTSGNPKGVMLTHGNLIFLAESVVRARLLNQSDKSYGVGPYAHIAGLQQLLGALSVGATSLMQARFSPAAMADALANRGLTVAGGVPAIWTKLFDWYQKEKVAPRAPYLRCATAGGSPVTDALRAAVQTNFGISLNNTYGMTEATPIAYTRMDLPSRADASVGPAGVGMEIKIVQSDGSEVSPGDVGELHVRGPAVMSGYFRRPDLTAAVLTADGWLNTGDLARQDTQSALFIVGRTKELVIRSGFNVYPAEIEEVLNAHPDVTQSAVVGRSVGGDEEVVAFVELAEDGSTEDLKTYLREHLAAYKIPSSIIVLDQMPASATGKILKNHLREIAAGTRTASPGMDKIGGAHGAA
jgi:acyl-CoA synthetase (AMP-forming)/AMP-acid ligase II